MFIICKCIILFEFVPQHVNRVYNLEYGHVARMVVSHVPHLIDKNVFDEMRRKFKVEWQQTSHHQLRRRDDMQVFEHLLILIRKWFTMVI